MEWYVIQVKTGQEESFRQASRTLIPADQAAEIYIPTRKLTIRRAGHERDRILPVYPGYVFLSTEDLYPSMAGAYRRVGGFIRWLGTNGKPQCLGDRDLDLLKLLLSNGEILGISNVRFDDNQRIVVLSGPLKGLEGRIIKVDKRKRRARVTLDLYNESFEVDFGFEIIGSPPKEDTSA